MIVDSDNDQDLAYVSSGNTTPTSVAQFTRGTTRKVVTCVVTTSKSDEERTVTGSLSGSESSSTDHHAPNLFLHQDRPIILVKCIHYLWFHLSGSH